VGRAAAAALTGIVVARAFAAREHGLYVGGRSVEGLGGRRLDVEDPATREVIGSIAHGGEADVEQAVSTARRAFDECVWSRVAPSDKARRLQDLAQLIEANLEELASLETLDNGKPISEARLDVAAVAEVFRYYAGWPTKLHGDTNPTEERFFSYALREPVGVCAQIVPWNFPLLMASWKVAPALACGNTLVLKPSRQTPLSALRLAELATEAGVPDGVFNVLTGDGRTGAMLAAHRSVDKVAFTGSTEVGRELANSCSATLKRLTLELGGKNANIVFADADLDRAVPSALDGAFENAGQACTAGSRILVERPVYDEFVGRLADAAEQLVVAPGLSKGAQIGALVSASQLASVRDYVAVGHEEGAALVAGEGDVPANGYFMRPTVFAGVSPEMRIAREEIFGPVVAAIPFEGEDEAVSIANGTEYGLACGLWTNDVKRAHRLVRRLRAGTVWVNAYGAVRTTVSFGGVKQSGYGRDLGRFSIDAYTEPKSVFVDVS
jgi:acyl-CoA reductase-like NAD-dependent aldehyde dehydrogenase